MLPQEPVGTSTVKVHWDPHKSSTRLVTLWVGGWGGGSLIISNMRQEIWTYFLPSLYGTQLLCHRYQLQHSQSEGHDTTQQKNPLNFCTFLSKRSHLWVDQSIEFVRISIGQVIRLLDTKQ